MPTFTWTVHSEGKVLKIAVVEDEALDARNSACEAAVRLYKAMDIGPEELRACLNVILNSQPTVTTGFASNAFSWVESDNDEEEA